LDLKQKLYDLFDMNFELECVAKRAIFTYMMIEIFFSVMREKPLKIQVRVGKVIVQETTPLLGFSKYLEKGGLSFALQLQGTARFAMRWSL